MDIEKYNRLTTNVAEAQSVEKEKAASLVKVTAEWKDSNEALNVHVKALRDFLSEQRDADLKKLGGTALGG